MSKKNTAPYIENLSQFHRGVEIVCARSPELGEVVHLWGTPPMWLRRPGFVSLVHIILEQQVSLASAQAVMDKLRKLLRRITPQNFLNLTDQELRNIGFSRQKTLYVRGLALAIVERRLSISTLKSQPADMVYDALLQQKGIGPWTANIYLMMVMRHPDIWPVGDLALRLAMRELFGKDLEKLAKKSTKVLKEDDVQQAFAAQWRPWRSVAVRICWLHYLRVRNR